MMIIGEYQSETIIIKEKTLIEKCSFAGLREGCIRFGADNLYVLIKHCFFLDCYTVEEHGGGICIQANNIVASIASCVASSCYTIPVDTKTEGQFALISSDGESSDISVIDVCVFLCAPYLINSAGSQSAPIYLSNGCREAKGINCTRNKVDLLSIFIRSNLYSLKISYITVADCESMDRVVALHGGNQLFSHCLFVHNIATNKVGIGANTYLSLDANIEDCSFVFDSEHTCSLTENSVITFNKCLIKNMQTSSATVKNPVSQIASNVHTELNTMLKDIFTKKTKKMRLSGHNILGFLSFITIISTKTKKEPF